MSLILKFEVQRMCIFRFKISSAKSLNLWSENANVSSEKKKDWNPYLCNISISSQNLFMVNSLNLDIFVFMQKLQLPGQPLDERTMVSESLLI